MICWMKSRRLEPSILRIGTQLYQKPGEEIIRPVSIVISVNVTCLVLQIQIEKWILAIVKQYN